MIPEPVVKTIIQEKVIYVDKEKEVNVDTAIKKTQVVKTKQEELLNSIPKFEVPLDEDKDYIVTRATDNKGRFSIVLSTSEKPDNKIILERRILLSSTIEDGDYKGKFFFTVPLSILENIDSVNIKITDAISNDTYSEVAYCMGILEKGYDYSMSIIYSNGFECLVEETGTAMALSKPSKDNIDNLSKKFANFKKLDN